MSVAESLLVAARWYLVVTLIGVLTYPLVFLITRNLWDRGVSLYRPLGIAIVILPIWIVGHITGAPLNSWLTAVIALAIGIPLWLVAIKRHRIHHFFTARWRTVCAFELVTAGLFFIYVVFRGFNPDISGTEKPMELAFLNAAINEGQIPITDPWFAGEAINYYAFGYAAFGGIAQLAQLPGEIAFNLALATVFATATVAAAGVASTLAVAIGYSSKISILVAATFSGFFIAVAGNLHAAVSVVRDPEATLGESWWSGVGWGSSRVIEDTGFADGSVRAVITEFPAFSWILGDLHPHVIAYPWLIVTFGLIVNLFLTLSRNPTTRDHLMSAAPVGAMIGVLYATNTWDVPLVVALTAIVFILGVRTLPWQPLLIPAAGIVLSALIVTLPFALYYDSPTGADGGSNDTLLGSLFSSLIGYVAWDRSSLSEPLVHWGALLIISVVIFSVTLQANKGARPQSWKLIGAFGGLLVIAAFVLSTPAIALFGIPALGFIAILFTNMGANTATRFAAGALGLGFLVLIAVEFVFVRDPFGDRMNTVFKLSFQVWALFAVMLGALLPSAIGKIRERSHRAVLISASFVLTLTMLATSLYAPLSAYRWTGEFAEWRGLEGLTYVANAQPDEYALIEWIRDSDESFGTILEAPGCSYGSDNVLPHNRVSMATGIPTVIGWDGHQYQWRRGQPDLLPEIRERIEHARQMYETPGDSQRLFEQYDVTHVVVGVHEIDGYQECPHGPPYNLPGEERYAALGWERAYESGMARVYRLPD